MAAQIVINADDFGCSESVNEAVARAHREGVLTSASLMVTGSAAREAVSVAKDNPGLAVGLHLVLTRERSVLPQEAVPRLVDRHSRFRRSPIAASLAYYFSSTARSQLVDEVEAQFDAFAEFGLTLSHVDGHQHLHAHPAVFPTVVELALRYGARGIRVPSDPLWPNLRADRSGLPQKLAVAVGHGYLVGVCRRHLRATSLAHCDHSVGSLASGRMTEEYVIRILGALRCASAELYFHPSTSESNDPYGPNTGDLHTLTSPALKQALADGEWEPTTYGGLRREHLETVSERG